MATIAATPPPAASAAVSRRPARLAVTLGTHSVVDFFSFLIIPIMSVLEGRLDLTPAQGAIILSAGSICSGFIQPVVAWMGDKLDTRMLGPVAFAAAVLAISLVGNAQSFEHLLLIQVVGTLGIGAFHPTAAAAAGQLAGRRRSLGVSLFFCAGMAGGVSGNVLSPQLAKHFGLPAYIWLAIPGLLAAAALAWAIRSVPHRHHDADDQRRAWTAEEARARWVAVAILYAGNVLRFTVNMMMVQLIIRWSEQVALARSAATTLTPAVRETASTINGPLQGAMQLGMAVGGLSAGAFLRRHHEKAALIAVPLVGALAVAGYPFAGALAEGMGAGGMVAGFAFVLAMATGVGYAGVVPVTIALGQRLLPHRTGLASGLMMGGAWGFAAVGPPLAQLLINRAGLETAFLATAGLLCAAGFLSITLSSRLLERISPH